MRIVRAAQALHLPALSSDGRRRAILSASTSNDRPRNKEHRQLTVLAGVAESRGPIERGRHRVLQAKATDGLAEGHLRLLVHIGLCPRIDVP